LGYKITPVTLLLWHIGTPLSYHVSSQIYGYTYSNVGAVAELFDVSCLYGTPSFNTIQNDAYGIWKGAASSVTAEDVIKKLDHNLIVLGQHYYVPNPNITTGSPAILPKWDFTSGAAKGAEGYVIAAKVGSLSAPTGMNDIDWVQLKKVKGGLADTVYRVYTQGGQPPASVSIILDSINFPPHLHQYF
jgi:hypothetical protein